MPLDPKITIGSIKDTFEFDAFTRPVPIMVYTYTIGQLGPFTSKFYANEQQQDHIDRVLNDRAALLRNQGVLG